MKFPRIEKVKYENKKEHIHGIIFTLLEIVECLVFVTSMGFYEWEISKYYLYEFMDD